MILVLDASQERFTLVTMTAATGNKIGTQIAILAPPLGRVTTLTVLSIPREWVRRGEWSRDKDGSDDNGGGGGDGGGCSDRLDVLS